MPLAHDWRRVDFAGGSAMAIAIPWGDLATAWFSIAARRGTATYVSMLGMPVVNIDLTSKQRRARQNSLNTEPQGSRGYALTGRSPVQRRHVMVKPYLIR